MANLDNPVWPGPAPEIDESEITATLRYDVVVIGGGHAGLGCALSAAEGGLSVAVIEKKRRDNMFWRGEQIGAFNSELAIEKGLGPYDLEEIINEICRVYSDHINRALVRKYVYHSGRVFDHYRSLVPESSTLFDDDQFNIHIAQEGTVYPIVRGGVKTWPGTMQFRGHPNIKKGDRVKPNTFSRLSEFLFYALNESERLGAEWKFGHEAVVIEKEGNRASAVIVKGPDGKYVRFAANRGILIALGNFTDMGNRLGVWAGGHMDNNPYEPMETRHMFRVPWFAFGNAGFLQLNNDGKRYDNECGPFSNALERQPDGLISFVTDSKWLEQIKTSSLIHGNADFGRPEYFEEAAEDLREAYELPDRSKGTELRNLGLTERETTHIYAADTLEELAGYLGYTGESLRNFLASIERYNELCRKGVDEDWGKDAECMIPIEDPPFYGNSEILKTGTFQKTKKYCGAFSGLHTNDDFAVVDNTCNPIENLYTAGESLGYYRCAFYYTPCGGNHIGSAMTHGYLIGEMLAGNK